MVDAGMDAGTDTGSDAGMDAGARQSAWPRAVADRPPVAVGLTVLGVGVGVGLIVAAGRQQLVWWLVLLFAAGITGLALAGLAWNDWVARRYEDAEQRRDTPELRRGATRELWWWRIVVVVLAVGGAAALLGAVVTRGSQVVGGIGVVALTAGLAGAYAIWSAGEAPVPPSNLPWSGAINGTTRAGVALMLLSSVAIAALPTFGWLGWVLLLAWLLGLIALKRGISPFLKSRRADMVPTAAVNLGLTLLGFVVLAVGARESSLLGVMLGLSLVVGALSVVGLALLYCDMPAGVPWLLVGLGLVGLGVGAWRTWQVVNGDGLGVTIAVFVFGVGIWYVLRGDGIVALLMIGWIAVWGIAGHTADVPADPHEGSDIHVLALGDSFISGEGADDFLPGTNVAGGNECRRSPTAYPYVVADELGYSLDFLACQGAKIDDLTRCGRMADEGWLTEEFGYDLETQVDPNRRKCTVEGVEWGDAQRAAVAARGEEPGFVPQLATFPVEDFGKYHVVLVSIGGNDAGFSTIVKSCLLPQDCSDQQEQWAALVAAQQPRLVALYRQLQELTGPGTRIVAMPYPPVATEEDCGLGLSEVEHEFLTEHIGLLEETIVSAATEAGIEVFDQGTREAYRGHDLCKKDAAGANHVVLESTEGSWAKRYLPSYWIHGSMHPNVTGHRALADALKDDVQRWAEQAEVDKAAAAEAGSDGAKVDEVTVDEVAVAHTDAVLEEPSRDDSLAAAGQALIDDKSWMAEELFTSVGKLIVPLLVLLFAGVFFAAGYLQRGWPLANVLKPRRAPRRG